MRRIAIAPADRFRRLVVVPDVPANFPREVSHGREDTAREEIPFDLGKPEFDLVEPRRVGWCEMEPHLRMFLQEVLDSFGLVSRQIIEDDMDLTGPFGFADYIGKKVDEVGAGVSMSCFALHSAGLYIQCSV